MMYRIRIYAGLTTGPGQNNVDPAGIFRMGLADEMAELFGGGTVYAHTGVWKDSKETVHEAGVTFEIIHETTGPDMTAKTGHFARQVKSVLQQKAVLITSEQITADFI